MIDDAGFLWLLLCWIGLIGCALLLMWLSVRRRTQGDDYE